MKNFIIKISGRGDMLKISALKGGAPGPLARGVWARVDNSRRDIAVLLQ